jgi:16S rRNA (guanine(966)-N(2))-methyltransferase RsmD
MGASARSVGLRIIGGEFRRRRLRYSGDPRVRPMKDRVREAVFNLLGNTVQGKHAVDLFAGTGALGLEALSRGAVRATFVEQHVPTATILRQNISILGVQDRAEVVQANVFLRVRWEPRLSSLPRLVFCCPPYAFFVERQEAMRELLRNLWEAAPPESALLVESDTRFDFRLLAEGGAWDVRTYPPAVVGITLKEG